MKTLFLLICLFQITEFAQEKIQLTISLEKDKYLILEGINIGFSYKNISSSLVELSNPYVNGGNLQLVVSRNDTILTYDGFQYTRIGETKFTLNPGEDFFYLYSSITFDYGELILKRVIWSMLPEGNYTLEALYLFEGSQIKSNKIFFSVIHPSDNELAVYNSFYSIIEDRSLSLEQMFKSLENLFQIHRNSKYAPMILEDIRIYYSVIAKDKNRMEYILNILITDYPCSHEVIGYHLNEYEKIKNDVDKERYYQEILSKCEGSFIGRYLHSRDYFRIGGK